MNISSAYWYFRKTSHQQKAAINSSRKRLILKLAGDAHLTDDTLENDPVLVWIRENKPLKSTVLLQRRRLRIYAWRLYHLHRHPFSFASMNAAPRARLAVMPSRVGFAAGEKGKKKKAAAAALIEGSQKQQCTQKLTSHATTQHLYT